MKRIAAALMVAGLGMFAGAGVADASGYPPDSGTVTVDFGGLDPLPDSSFNIIVDCLSGETITVEFPLGTILPSATCTLLSAAATTPPATGSATIALTTPSEPGTYTGNVTLGTTGTTTSFTVTVAAPTTTAAPSPVLPATGSSGTNSTLWIAGLMLAFGAGMFGVARVRRQQPTTV